MGKHCLYFCLCFQLVTYPLSFTTPAILKATSDVKYVMFSAVASMFIMRVGLAFLLTTDKIAGLPQLGAFGYWIGMCSDWVLRSVLFLARLLSGKWKKSSGLLTAPAPEPLQEPEPPQEPAPELPQEPAPPQEQSAEAPEEEDANVQTNA